MQLTDIERLFFGRIDERGRRAAEYFANFAHPSVNGDAFQDLVLFMSTQKLRTPKGLGYIADLSGTNNHQALLNVMLRLRGLHCAIWAECIWQIADASESETKFIVSDHPVTVYNRTCGPRSNWCRGNNDPEIWLNATHTIFPLSLEKVLILTNLSWARNPYQKEIAQRPNPNPFRNAIFNFMEIQTLRHLSEQEVREINFIIKTRAKRYIAAAKEEWLYPERYVSRSNWADFGQGYLLMPDPRPLHAGGTLMWGGGPGGPGAMDEYGRRPEDPDFERETNTHVEFDTLERFKGEFAFLFGPTRRGRSFAHAHMDDERDSDDYHKIHLSRYKKRKNR